MSPLSKQSKFFGWPLFQRLQQSDGSYFATICGRLTLGVVVGSSSSQLIKSPPPCSLKLSHHPSSLQSWDSRASGTVLYIPIVNVYGANCVHVALHRVKRPIPVATSSWSKHSSSETTEETGSEWGRWMQGKNLRKNLWSSRILTWAYLQGVRTCFTVFCNAQCLRSCSKGLGLLIIKCVFIHVQMYATTLKPEAFSGFLIMQACVIPFYDIIWEEAFPPV